MEKCLIQLKDAYVYEIEDGFDHIVVGCPTCGLDDEYISEITFKVITEKGYSIDIEVSSVGYWKFEITVADILKLLLANIDNMKNMTYSEFETWLKNKLIHEREV